MTTVYNGSTALELVDQAAEAIRGVNHLTRDDHSLQHPSDVYNAIGGLVQPCQRLPQALDQLDRLVERWGDAGHLGVDGERPDLDLPRVAAATMSSHLEEANAGLNAATEALGAAQAAIGHLTWGGPEREVTTRP